MFLERLTRRVFVLFVFIITANNAFAQTMLLDIDYYNRHIQVGDTIIFCYTTDRIITPKTSKLHKDTYIDGFFYARPHYNQEDRKKKHPIFAYKGTNQSNWTNSNVIAEKEMVVLSFEEEATYSPHNRFKDDRYLRITLYNVIDNDTLILLEDLSSLQKTKPYDYIRLPQHERNISKKIIKPNLYREVRGTDTIQYDRKILTLNRREYRRAEEGVDTKYIFFRKISINSVNVRFTSFWGDPKIDFICMDNYGNREKYSTTIYSFDDTRNPIIQIYINDHLDGLSNIKIYTDADINEIEENEKKNIESAFALLLQEKRMAGYYHFELTKVDKIQSTNTRKGIITKNSIYEDNIISIKWDASEYKMRFSFSLKNLTNNTMKLLWDEALIVNFEGYTERVIHNGSDIESVQKSQQPSIIPPLAQLADFYCSEHYWGEKRLQWGYGGSSHNGGINAGKQMRLILPIQVGAKTYTYSFTFTLKWEYKYPELQE